MINMFYKKALTIAQQMEGMKQWPCFSAQSINSERYVSWIGQLQPFDDSEIYVVEIRYTLLNPPYVGVLHPTLSLNAPHVNRNGSLCLYHPDDPYHLIWTPDKLISETITCWTAEWLAKYELWKDRGIWYGLEAPHN